MVSGLFLNQGLLDALALGTSCQLQVTDLPPGVSSLLLAERKAAQAKP